MKYTYILFDLDGTISDPKIGITKSVQFALSKLNIIDAGLVLYVATSKPTIIAKHILDYFQIDQYFKLIVGSNLDGTMTDKSEIIKYIIEKENLEKDKIVMIGDRKHDIIGANNNGINSIGVGYGYGGEAELRNAHLTYYVNTLDELGARILTSISDKCEPTTQT